MAECLMCGDHIEANEHIVGKDGKILCRRCTEASHSMLLNKKAEEDLLRYQHLKQTNNNRVARWKQKKTNAGYRQIGVLLQPKAYRILEQESKKTGKSRTQIINAAICNLGNKRGPFPAE